LLHLPFARSKPPQISRHERALPTWQNNIAMNWPQLVKPLLVPFGLVPPERLLKTPARKQLQHLRENVAYFP
jgi:hypothetical protein